MDEDWEHDAKTLCLELLEDGMLCKQTHGNKIRISPPLIIEKDQVDVVLGKINTAMNKLS